MMVERVLTEFNENRDNNKARQIFQKLIQSEQRVGDLYSINYETARVIVHDYFRESVGGVPSLSFLIASRINLEADDIDFRKEDASCILLRVMDSAQLPQDKEAERIRVETAQRVSGESKNWDQKGVMDVKTRDYLSYSGIQCRIIGTFFLEKETKDPDARLRLKFGSDISNFYPNRGLKVYKPNGEALRTIVNYCDPSTLKNHIEKYHNSDVVQLGHIRYASTNRKHQKIDDVPVFIYPADLLSQKSALFGMTRTGKSNTTKIIAKSVYELRLPKNPEDKELRVGQVIFDPNGEYANENTQDSDESNNPNALKNIWEILPDLKKEAHELKAEWNKAESKEEKTEIWKQIRSAVEKEVVTYGLLKHPKDPFRRIMKINFYDETSDEGKSSLEVGKEIIDTNLMGESAQYMKNFRNISLQAPSKKDYDNEKEFYGYKKRHDRHILVYKTILKKAGFKPQAQKARVSKGLFNKALCTAMQDYNDGRSVKKTNLINEAGSTLLKSSVTWDALARSFEGLFYFLSTGDYNDFNREYMKDDGDSTGEGWADSYLESLLEMFKYSKAINLIGNVKSQHTTDVRTDYADDIYEELKKGKLVIVDQSSGDPELNKTSANRIMWRIFKGNQALFRQGEENLPEILVYLEEAHNILPAGTDLDLSDVWVRTAKEGAKYRIGMVYATQEVSSIQRNILKNTANWFISHLNNTDETKELCKYYDFADFEPSIRRAQDKGFLRVKTLSNLFVIPVQVDLFEVK